MLARNPKPVLNLICYYLLGSSWANKHQQYFFLCFKKEENKSTLVLKVQQYDTFCPPKIQPKLINLFNYLFKLHLHAKKDD